MFGALRTYLAVMVVAFHLLGIPLIGPYAVFSFFVLSGFLMTTIMHDIYGYSFVGRKRYLLNRALRLYPVYWISAIIGILVILYCGKEFLINYRETIYIPKTNIEIFSNFTMIFPNFFPALVEPRLSPPTWAITVELCYYVLICMGISRNIHFTMAWLSVSLIYVLITVSLGDPHAYRYASILAGSLPFSIGSMIYFYKELIKKIIFSNRFFSLSNIIFGYLANFAVNVAIFHYTKNDLVQESGLYVSTILAALLIVKLNYLETTGALKRLDKVIGGYSYPIYLLHWQLGALASFLLGRFAGHAPGAAAVFVLAMAMVLAVGTAIVFGVDPAIERLRAAVRRPAPPQDTLEAVSVAS